METCNCTRLAIDWPGRSFELPAGSSVDVDACCIECGRRRSGRVTAVTNDGARARWDIGVLTLHPSRVEMDLWQRMVTLGAER